MGKAIGEKKKFSKCQISFYEKTRFLKVSDKDN